MADNSMKLRFIYTVLLLSGDMYSVRSNFYRSDNIQSLKRWGKRNSSKENNIKIILLQNVSRSNIVNRIKRSSETSERINLCMKYANCSSNVNVSFPICYCDNACIYYKDCCSPDLALADDNEITDESAERMKLARCDIGHKTRFFPIINNPPLLGYYVISTCPEPFQHDEIKQKCYLTENVLEGAPVTGRDGLVYSNMYCAVCNSMTEFQFWTYHFTVTLNPFGRCMYPFDYLDSNMTTIEKLGKSESDQCQGRFVPPENFPFPRVCISHTIYLNNSPEDNENCLAFSNPVYVKLKDKSRVAYKNSFCIPDSLEYNSNNIKCLRPKDSFLKGYGKPMTVIFQLRPPLKVSGNQVCMDDSEVFDPNSGMCARKTCIADMSCFPIRVVNFRFAILSNIVTDGMVDPLFLKRTLAMFWNILPRKRYNLRYISASHDVSCNRQSNSSISEYCCALYGTLEIDMQIEENGDYIKSTSMKMQDIIWSYTEIGVNFTINAKNYLENGSKIGETSPKFQMCEGYGEERYTYKHTLNQLEEINIKFEVLGHGQTTEEIPVRFEVEVFIHENTNSMQNMTVHKLEIIYKKTISKDEISEDNGWSLQTIMTYVTMTISCLTLLCTIITYSCLGLSSNPPGQISQNMMSNILISHLLFLSGIGAIKYKTLCLIIGIVSHYLWISAFIWISVFIVRVTVMLRTIKYNPAYSLTERLNLRDYLIGYTVPFLVVVPSVVLDFCNYTPLNLTYSGEICFPSGYPGNMIVFTFPVLLSLLVNMVSFIWACISLRKYNITTPSFQISRSYISLYIRLCIISACPWILGIVAEITNQNIIRYLYILLAGLHGFFVSLCFLVRKRILTAIRNWSENHQDIEFMKK